MPTHLLTLPPRLKILYDQSPHGPAADLAQQYFLPWLQYFGTNLPFFPEYTDHGIHHLNSVLASAEALIPDHVWGQTILRTLNQKCSTDIPNDSLLTLEDATLFVLSVLLHDAAMALTEDQFLALVVPTPSSAVIPGSPISRLAVGQGDSAAPPRNAGILPASSSSEISNLKSEIAHYPLTAPPLDPSRPDKEKPFPDLFDDFLAEARRWDGRKLANILGTSAQGESDDDLISYIQHPKELGSPLNWKSRHHRFFGEFIRQHHPRLAHHFALHGLPPIAPRGNAGQAGSTTPPPCPPHLPNELPSPIKDLAGLIARSHGIPLRDTFDYFAKFDPGSDPPDTAFVEGTHPIYLMVLLRIADYLQMDSSRLSNPTLDAINDLRSPLSRSEYKSHLAIQKFNVKIDQRDREALKIIAFPDDVGTFLKLRRNISGLQQELDTSWAVLGEVFSRLADPDRDMSKLGLRLRRVKSNIDSPERFLKDNPSCTYYPYEAKFGTAGTDLLKLLIKPLYGDRPSVGVRELLQNSLDAVRELDFYCRHHHIQKTSIPFPPHTPDIDIHVEQSDGHFYLTITDKGIGMKPKTICDYFLKVGASFRASDEWQREFENGSPLNVIRSGRFGIGVLAAFLLGDSIEVITCHIEQRETLEGTIFKCSLLSPSIELERKSVQYVGTRLRIRLNSGVAAKLTATDEGAQKNWDWHSLTYPIVRRRNPNVLTQEHHFPECGAEPLPPGWFRSRVDEFDDVQWTYTHMGPNLTCNGIIIASTPGSSSILHWPRHFDIPFQVPSLAIFDSRCRLPLKIQRDALTLQTPGFLEEVLPDVSLLYCAAILALAPTSTWGGSEQESFSSGTFWGFPSPSFARIMAGTVQFARTPQGSLFLHAEAFRNTKVRGMYLFPHTLTPNRPCSFNLDIGEATTRIEYHQWESHADIERLVEHLLEKRDIVLGFSDVHTRVLVSPELAQRPEFRSSEYRTTTMPSGWTAFESGTPCSTPQSALESYFPREFQSGDFPLIAHLSFNIFPLEETDSPFARIFREYFKDPIIPYDLGTRREKFAYAYKTFGSLITKLENWKSGVHP